MRSINATSDAGPLIHLSKIRLLELLKSTYHITIPAEVKVEVVDQGKRKGSADALLIENAIKEGWITVVTVGLPDGFARLCELAGLQKGEAAVLGLAMERKTPALLDDQAARMLGRSLGIPVRGTLGILVEAVRKNSLGKAQALSKLDELSDVMYLSGELYRLARRAIEEA